MEVLCDVDGVLAQWKVAFKAYLEEVGFEIDGINWTSPTLPLTKAQREYAWMKMSEREVAFNLDPFPEAIDGLNRILDLPDTDVYFVTAQVERSPTWVYDRTHWLIKHFGDEQGNKIIATHHKHMVRGDVLIDDKEYNIAPWKEKYPNSLAILWDHPHNQGQPTAGLRCDNWSQLFHMIKDRSLKG